MPKKSTNPKDILKKCPFCKKKVNYPCLNQRIAELCYSNEKGNWVLE